MKKHLLLLLGALIALPTVARDFQYTYEGQTINYTVIDEEAKTCKIASNTNVEGKVEIPEIAKDASNNYTVTAIGGKAFRGCSGLTSVIIPNSVTWIGIDAFCGCTSLTSVTIPNSVTTIRISAFFGCTGLTSLTIPNSVTEISKYAFFGCSGLTSVDIGESVSYLGDGAFGGCTTLKTINIASGNSNYISVDGIVYSKDMSRLLQYPAGKEETKFAIPNSVTEIGGLAFCYCSSITSVTIPNSVTEIGGWAFSGCSSLTSAAIPNSVTEIGNDAFSYCSSLTSVTIPNSVTYIDGDAFRECSGLTSVTYLAEEPLKSYQSIFSDDTYQKATLNYLKSAEEKIASTSPWSHFINRIGRDADYKEEGAISEVQATDGAATTVYDMRGVKVGTSTSGLQRGIYIANGRKIFVR